MAGLIERWRGVKRETEGTLEQKVAIAFWNGEQRPGQAPVATRKQVYEEVARDQKCQS